MRKCGISRDNIFIITKVTNIAQRQNTVVKDLEASLRNLRTDYIDLYLLHWPQTDTWLDSWKVMEQILSSGKVKGIGVCNCKPHHLEELLRIADVIPLVNECECHLLLQQNDTRKYCREHGIKLIAHTPLGRLTEQIRGSKELKEICNKYQISLSQLIMRWHYQLGDVSIPNTTSLSHLSENEDIWDFELLPEDMEVLKGFDSDVRIWPDPDCCDFTRL